MKLSSWMVAPLVFLSSASAAWAKPSARVDAFTASKASRAVPVPSRPLAKLATVAHVEARLGVPTFVWGARPGPSTASVLGSLEALRPEVAARRHLFELAELYRLSPEDVSAAQVRAVHDTGAGGLIVTFRQSVEGLTVFRDELSVLMNRQRELVAISGHLTPVAATNPAWLSRFALTAPTAAAMAFEDLTGERLDPAALKVKDGARGGYSQLTLSAAARAALTASPLIPLRTKPVLFQLAEGLEPGFYVEVKAGDKTQRGSRYFSYVVSAVNGRVLFKNNLSHDAAFTYRVWADATAPYVPFDGPQGIDASPHPTGLPDGYQSPFAAPNLLTLDNAGLSTNDPWVTAGATTTRGNNADAYLDLAAPDGFGAGDVRAELTSAATFDYTYDPALGPGAGTAQQKASVVNLFFLNNFLHDWYYDSGFDELSGNAQTNNYGRGGLEGDAVLAEGQDYSGRDNSNMQVPSDGANPVMQMFVFTGNGTRELSVTSPAAVAGAKNFGSADFGPTAFSVVGNLVRADDGAAPVSDACTPLVNGAALTGQVAFIDRGSCTFVQKALAAQAAGAAAVIIANNQAGGPMPLTGFDASITIPAVSVSQNTGNALTAQLTAGALVALSLVSDAGVDRDGTLDNAIVAHEWGHYLANRLVADANGLTNNQGDGMGEGWADFHSLLMEVRSQDALATANVNWAGVYGLATYTSSGGGNNGYYYGIRRVPYSTDFTKNALTFKHIQDGVALPATAPVAFGANGASNSEVHATGEVWATMLWECYAALLRDSGRLTFTQAQDRMKAYLVASYKLTPAQPTFLEARDALMAAALAADPVDFVLFGQAFARRGMGVGALGPARDSMDNVGVTESFVSGGALSFVGATLNDAVDSCDDDGILDNTETGRLTVTLKNTGTAALSSTTATVSSTNPALSFSNGGQLTFAASQPFGVMTATLEVSLAGLAGSQRVPIAIGYTDPGMAAPAVVTATLTPRLNYDDLPAAAAFDDVESPAVRWTIGHDPYYDNSSPFRRVEDSTGAHWFGPNPGSPEDQTLVSPQLQVSALGRFVISFRHRYSFEADTGQAEYYDGAVVELRKAGGSWEDIGGSASPAYPVKMYPGITIRGNFYPSANPLRARPAFGGDSPGYPAYHTTTIDLGTAYAGTNVEVRFRVGADRAGAAVGWDLDDIAFSGIDNTPFNRVQPGHATCGNRAPSANAGADLTVDEDTQASVVPTASDPDGDPITHSWVQAGGPTAAVADTTSATLVFNAPKVTRDETLTFQLMVSDGQYSSAPSSVRVLVRNVNQVPVANAGTNQSVDERAEVTLSGSLSVDANADALSYAWTQVAGPHAELLGADTLAPTFVAPDVDAATDLVFSLTVSDALSSSEPSTVTVSVADVFAPVKKAGCGCAAGGSPSSVLPFALAFALLAFRRRDRSPARSPRA